jgi:DNA-binding transcriptional regulator PaaX
MSIVMEILEDLWNAKLRYKGAKVNAFGIPIFWDENKNCPKNSFDKTLDRLIKNGFVETQTGKYFLTESGRRYFENKNKLAIKFASPFLLNAPKNLLLMFDIPESRKAERNWLRRHLIDFQYYMIQKSVWVGPSPLPKKFKDHTKNMGLDKFVKTFKLAKPYQITKK